MIETAGAFLNLTVPGQNVLLIYCGYGTLNAIIAKLLRGLGSMAACP